MPKLLLSASYTAEGVRGVVKEGGSSRRAAVEQAVGALGGTLEAFYFAYGDQDVFLIVDFPDNASATSFSLAVNSSGALRGKVAAVLLTPEEVDEASRKVTDYRPPGG